MFLLILEMFFIKISNIALTYWLNNTDSKLIQASELLISLNDFRNLLRFSGMTWFPLLIAK